MSKTFKCPSCGGPLDYEGGDALTVRCPFCSNSVIVPPELRAERTAPAEAAAPVTPAAPVPPAAAVAPAAPAAPTDPDQIKAQLKEARHAAHEQRKALRHQLHEARHNRRHP